MSRTYQITFSDDVMTPEYLERIAQYHQISTELYIKRLLSQSVDHMHPEIKDISNFDSLDECFIANGLRKCTNNRWHTVVLMTEPENPLLVQLRQQAEQLQLSQEDLALQYIAAGLAASPARDETHNG